MTVMAVAARIDSFAKITLLRKIRGLTRVLYEVR
jgi:hypothetical protein